jgi:hypothetical protein
MSSIRSYKLEEEKNMIIINDKDNYIGLIRTYNTKDSEWEIVDYNAASLKDWKSYEHNDLIIEVDNTLESIENIKIYSPKQNSSYFTLTVPLCNSCNDVAVINCNTCSIDINNSFYCSQCFRTIHAEGITKYHKYIGII